MCVCVAPAAFTSVTLPVTVDEGLIEASSRGSGGIRGVSSRGADMEELFT